MTSKIKRLVLCVLVLLCGACAFTACKFGTTVDDIKNRYNLTALVIYHANGGVFNNQKDTAELYYAEGAKPLNIGTDRLNSGTINVAYTEHTFNGWYADEACTQAYNFDVRLRKDDKIDLYAGWITNQKVEVILASESEISNTLVYTDSSGTTTTYHAGDVLKEYAFSTGGSVEKPRYDVLTGRRTAPKGYVFAAYYTDEECTNQVTWPIAQTDDEENIRIYAKYLSEDWMVVSTTDDAQTMFQSLGNKKYYLVNDIDCSSVIPGGLSEVSEFSGTIRGNGYTISGLSFELRGVRVGQSKALFNKITSTARISDLTLKDFSISLASMDNAMFTSYFLATECESGAQISGLMIDGGTFSVRLGKESIMNGTNYTSDAECPLAPSAVEGVTITKLPEFILR